MKKRFRTNRRPVLQILLVLSLLFVLDCFQLSPFSLRTARAATRIPSNSITSSAVPAAAVDSTGNRFIFWRGADASKGLWEGSYEATTSRWYGPTNIPGMGPLGSEPTVTVDTNIAMGAAGYAYQFVFWQGADTHHGLWEAYWDGSWHGPINLGMGTLGSKPSATFDAFKGVLTVVWRGMDSNLWYTYNRLTTNGQQQTWQGPYKASWGPMQNPPTAADAGDGNVKAFWRGNNGYLWYGTLQAGGTPDGFGPQSILQSGLLGSDPSATGLLMGGTVSNPGSPYYAVFWAGRDNGLWTIRTDSWGDPIDPNPTELPNMGPLGSAPSCSYWQATQAEVYYCYWAGDNAGYNLWEASYNPGTISGPTNRGMGPLQ